MVVSVCDIEKYLIEVKQMIREGKYSIAWQNRDDNNQMFDNYLICENDVKEILLGLEVFDFSEVRQNEHKRFNHEKLYIFGKEVKLLKRFSNDEKIVPLYIKLNKIEERLVIIVSFHEQKRPLKYCFK